MRKLLFLFAVSTLSFSALSAQCPTATRSGIHVVQYGETLYRISKLYNASIDDLRSWNGMEFNQLLSICQELVIVPPNNTATTTTFSTPVFTNQTREVFVERRAPTRVNTIPTAPPANIYQRQQGRKHQVQQGETIANIARLYGYTEARFREFNVLHPDQESTPGSVLLTTDCSCDRVSYSEHANGLFNGQWNQRLIPQSQNGYYHKTYDANTTPNTYTNNYYTPPNSTPSYTTQAPFNPNNGNGGAATAWGNVATNKPPTGTGGNTNTSQRINQGATGATNTQGNNWRSNQGATNTQGQGNWRGNQGATNTQGNTWRRNQGTTNTQGNTWRRNQGPSPATTRTNNANQATPVPYSNEPNASTYMTNEELTMIDEINLIRSDPAGYVRYVEQYIQDIRSGKAFGSSTTAAYELIEELKRTGPLSVLKPIECLYRAAQKHGQEAIRKGSSDHQGSNGSWPWDRAKRACPQIADGNENLVGGPGNVREAVMLLLVDDGISNRGHRKTLLQKDWKYVACYKSGQVGRMPNSWVQMFGN